MAKVKVMDSARELEARAKQLFERIKGMNADMSATLEDMRQYEGKLIEKEKIAEKERAEALRIERLRELANSADTAAYHSDEPETAEPEKPKAEEKSEASAIKSAEPKAEEKSEPAEQKAESAKETAKPEQTKEELKKEEKANEVTAPVQQKNQEKPRQRANDANRPQQGGYQQRGGYNAGGRQGYGNNRQGGYQQRGGYNNRQGGFRQQGGGFAPNPKAGFKKRIDYKDDSIDPNEPMRLNKYLANAGVCSRREADEFIQAGVVTVNGAVVTELGTKVLRSDEVKFHDQPVSLEKKVYVLLNKPKDYVTTSDDPQQRKTVMDLVKNACPERIYPVGRLDRNTTGVLLLTNDGDMASKLTHPKFLKKKIYHVHLDKNVTAHDLQQIRDGITLEDGEIKADDVQYADPVDKKQVGIEIHSGKNRIVRRIFEKLGYRVTKLDRVQFAGLTKKGLRRGDWRYLTEEEVVRLRMGSYE